MKVRMIQLGFIVLAASVLALSAYAIDKKSVLVYYLLGLSRPTMRHATEKSVFPVPEDVSWPTRVRLDLGHVQTIAAKLV